MVTGNVSEAARQTGIPESSIHQWMDSSEFAELRERTKLQVTGEWWGFVQQAFRRTSDLLNKTDDPVKAATAGAIIFDKMALASGDATSRTETRSLTDDLDDHEAEVLGEVIRGELARRKDGDTAIPAVAGDAAGGAEAPSG